MILLDFGSMVLEQTILSKFKQQGKSYTHITLCDFDGCQYDVTSDDKDKNVITVSINWPAYNDLKQYGVESRLKTVYGALAGPAAPGFDFSLKIDTTKGNAEETATKVGLLKRHTFASVFDAIFESLDGKGSVPDVITINYRRHEALYLKKTDGNRVVCIFSINFQDKDDIVYSSVFLKELADARKQLRSAPPVMFSHAEAPLELKGVQNLYSGEDQGYVSFVVFAGQAGSERRAQTIDNIMLFRNYLMYHIKCAKAYLNIRMRNKTAQWLQVLNRAKMKEESDEKKTITGRTFTRN